MDEGSLSSKTFIPMLLFFFDDLFSKMFGQQAANTPECVTASADRNTVSPYASPDLRRNGTAKCINESDNITVLPYASQKKMILNGTSYIDPKNCLRPYKSEESLKNHETDASMDDIEKLENLNQVDPFDAPTPKAGSTASPNFPPAFVLCTPERQTLEVSCPAPPFASTPAMAPAMPWSPESPVNGLVTPSSNAPSVAFGEHKQRLSNPEVNNPTGTHPAFSEEQLRCLRIRDHQFLGFLAWNQNIGNHPPVTAATPALRFSPSEKEYIHIPHDEITDEDIYCGQEYRGSSHPGNVRFRDIVKAKQIVYRSFGSHHGKKTAMSTSILEEEVKGRFIRMYPDGEFYLLTKKEARKKVSQALRDK
jgi:hypothetical protein